MGPGFFIFFREDEIQGGAGYPVYIQEKTVKRVRRIIRKIYKKKKKLDKAKIQKIINAMAKEWPEKEVKKAMKKFDVSREIAISNYKKSIKVIINDEEIVIILLLL